jgi:hypothetical protein
MSNLIGIGLYTPAEASSLLKVPAAKISRWLRGHRVGGRDYQALWNPEIDLGDGHTYLGFRDLMEVRIADTFIRRGVSPQRVRAAILLAREILDEERPLSTNRFRTDGRDIFLHVIEQEGHGGEGRESLLNLFRRQYVFKHIMDPLLKTVDFDEGGTPSLWWPAGRKLNIVVDPARAFGQPIDAATSVPTAVLAAVARQEGIRGTARAYAVPASSVRRAVEFEEQRRAA